MFLCCAVHQKRYDPTKPRQIAACRDAKLLPNVRFSILNGSWMKARGQWSAAARFGLQPVGLLF